MTMTTKRTTPAERRAARRSPAAHERQRDPERTKAAILDAAVAEFSAKGFAGARVSGIARRAGVNQQLIAYYFDSKEGLYREIGRRWRAYEADTFSAGMDPAEVMRGYVRLSVDPERGGRLLAWEGLADTGEDPDEEAARERNDRLRQEVDQIRAQQAAGAYADDLDPRALNLIMMAAANALAVYPQLARGLFGTAADAPELVDHYADQLNRIIGHLAPTSPGTKRSSG